MKRSKEVDKYMTSFPPETRTKLQELRRLIRKQAPEAEERISYRIPAFYQNGYIVWFAGYAKHIGFYPTAVVIEKFRKRLSKYKCSRGTVQFPLDIPLPVKLIGDMVRFRVKEVSRRIRNART